MAGAKCRSWVHAVVVQAKALNPFFCGRRESPHVRSRPGSPPLHSTLALLNSVHQVPSPPKMPGNCLPSLPLPCAISSLSLVRYRTNDHSVPVAYGNRDVLVRATWTKRSSAAGPRSSPGTRAPTRGTILCTIPSTTCRSWSRSRAPWTRPRPRVVQFYAAPMAQHPAALDSLPGRAIT